MAGQRAVRGTPKERLLPWHLTDLIPLMAQGYGKTAIMARLGKSKGSVEQAMNKPAVRAAVARAREVSFEKLGNQIAAQMLRDTPKNLAFLQSVRDAEILNQRGEEPEFRERIVAATRLMDSQVPRRHISSQQVSGTIGVGVFSATDAQDISALAIDAGLSLPALLPPPGETGES